MSNQMRITLFNGNKPLPAALLHGMISRGGEDVYRVSVWKNEDGSLSGEVTTNDYSPVGRISLNKVLDGKLYLKGEITTRKKNYSVNLYREENEKVHLGWYLSGTVKETVPLADEL